MNTPEIISEPINWLSTAVTNLGNILFAPIKFGREVLAESLSLAGHGIQVVEAVIINVAGSVLERAIEITAPAVEVLLEQADAWSNPLTDIIGDTVAEAAVFFLGLLGVELPSFSGLGCYGM
jgi:hypothetical protein